MEHHPSPEPDAYRLAELREVVLIHEAKIKIRKTVPPVDKWDFAAEGLAAANRGSDR